MHTPGPGVASVPADANGSVVVLGLVSQGISVEELQGRLLSSVYKVTPELWGRSSQETGAVWLTGKTQIKVAGHAHITTPHSLKHPPPHQPPHIRIHAERTREHVCAFTPAHECRELRPPRAPAAISLLHLPILETPWTTGDCAPGSPT